MRWSRVTAAGTDAPPAAERLAFPCLTLPGLDNSGPAHWQSRWEAQLPDCRRVDFGDWHDPDPLRWATRLGEAVRRADDGVVLVAHSLGCHAMLWWAASAPAGETRRVRAALLVAPPYTVGSDDARIRRFSVPHAGPLPFRSVVVGSDNDPYAALAWTEGWAGRQGATSIRLAGAGHINAASRLGAWPAGQRILADLVAP